MKDILHLKGYVSKIITRNNNYVLFVLNDYRYGSIMCKVLSANGLYYNLDFSTVYEFEAHLQGKFHATENDRVENSIFIDKVINKSNLKENDYVRTSN